MLAVAKRSAPPLAHHLIWQQGRAEALPFDPHSFDAVVSQFGLMFFEDRVKALQEMVRVLRPNGYLAIAVWESLERIPGYRKMVDLLQRLFGDEAANTLRAPFALGDIGMLRDLCRAAGIPQAQITTHAGTARFPSVESWVYTNVKGWTLAASINDEQYALFLEEAKVALQPFVQADGTVAFDCPAHIIAAQAQ
jgi:SAM-dependent methyltransferase